MQQRNQEVRADRFATLEEAERFFAQFPVLQASRVPWREGGNLVVYSRTLGRVEAVFTPDSLGTQLQLTRRGIDIVMKCEAGTFGEPATP